MTEVRTRAELEADVERLLRWKAGAIEVIRGLQELGKALGLRPGEQVTGDTAREAAEKLRAQADALSLSDKYDYPLDEVTHFVDGDTFDCVVSSSVGFHVRAQVSIRVRLLYVDTYEVHKGSIDDRTLGLHASDFTQQWLTEHQGLIHVRTVDQDSFGRWLSEVYAFYPGINKTVVLADDLVAAGFQKPGSKYGPVVS